MSKSNPFSLPEDRLASTTSAGGRAKIYPADVKGLYRTKRQLVQGLLLGLFLVLPWGFWHGRPLFRLDVVHRHFDIFGLSFAATDVPMLFFVLAFWVFGIAVVTSLWGRVWCGWACPQTVFIESVYRRIERLVEGNAHSQRMLDAAPWSKKWHKKTLKTGLYLFVSLVIAHSFLAYFMGPDLVGQMMLQSPLSHPFSAAVVAVVTAIIWFDFGVFREQFCIIACPYGRLQSVLMDDHSRTVMYDHRRGEPRDKTGLQGDCLDCYRCVQVCPTGVDIRRGTQLECIGCTACIDSCDAVMHKVGKPKGLVRYDSLAHCESPTKGVGFSKRLILYGVLLVAVLLGAGITVFVRDPLAMTVLRQQTYVQMPDGRLMNVFTVHVVNRKGVVLDYAVGNVPDVVVQLGAQAQQQIGAHARDVVPLVLQFSPEILMVGRRDIDVPVTVQGPGYMRVIRIRAALLGPVR